MDLLSPLTSSVLCGLALCACLPFVLPPLLIRLRMMLFVKINGDAGIEVPNNDITPAQFKELYNSPLANLRSKQATVGLSDLFWYFLCPGPDIHQEHVESGTQLYDMVTDLTKFLLNVPTSKLEALATKHILLRLRSLSKSNWHLTRLRDEFFPVFSSLFYELLFDEVCSTQVLGLCVKSGQNVINALKCTELRDMAARDALTAHLEAKLRSGALASVCETMCAPMTVTERALYLQGVYFHTGCVQMSEAMAHACLALATHPQERLRLLGVGTASDEYAELFVAEVLRAWPLFGIAHRITSGPIDVKLASGATTIIPTGTVLCFNYPKFQSVGYERSTEFLPDRWSPSKGGLSKKDSNYIPFGVPRNRPCPAQRVALLFMRVMTKVVVTRARFYSSVSHDRSLPGRGLCLVVPIPPSDVTGQLGETISPVVLKLLLWRMLVQDRVDGLFRSMAQLVFSTYMVLDAKKQALARRYQEGSTPRGAKPAHHSAASQRC